MTWLRKPFEKAKWNLFFQTNAKAYHMKRFMVIFDAN